MYFEGAISAKSALVNKRRKINALYVNRHKRTKDFKYILKMAKEADVKIVKCEKEDIEALAKGNSHGGMILEVENRSYESLDVLKDDTVFVIDGIEDPFNIGYIMRTLRAFGYHHVILPSRDLTSMEATIQKSSAGAFDALDVIISEDLKSDLLKLKKERIILALSRSEKAHNIFSYDYPLKKVIIIGGEKRGIKKEILNIVNEELYIEYPSDFRNALNAASALNVIVTILETRKYQ